MKVAVILATRGRPAKALAAIEALRILESGKHTVEVMLACDDDDPADSAGFFRAYDGVTVDVAPRPAGVGECWNRLAEKVDADLVVHLADDALILNPSWDDTAVRLFGEFAWPHPDIAIAGMHDTNSPGQATLFVFRPGWVRHCGFLDTRFPFWFADTAIQELWTFVTGTTLPFLPLIVKLPKGDFNPRLRDMGLWWTLYAATRQERLQTAAKVRAALNLPRPDNLADIVAAHQSRDLQAYPDSVDLVRHMKHRKPPDEKYVSARYAALAYLQQHDAARHLTGEKTALEFALETMETE